MTVGEDQATGRLAPVVLSVTVRASVAKAYRFYTERIADWWPLDSHSVGGVDAEACVIEGEVGGRIVESTRNGSTHVWGTISVWEPPERLVHSWHPGREPEEATEVAVTFTDLGDGTTRVTLSHSGWEAYGPRAADVRGNYDTGWPPVLERFAARAAD